MTTLATLVALIPSANATPFLEIQGTCPGTNTLLVEGLRADGPYAVVTGNELGSVRIPSGPCAGTELGLGPDGVGPRAMLDANSLGNALLLPSIPAHACGDWVQVVDMTTCQVSNVALLAENERQYTYVGEARTFEVPFGTSVIHVTAAGAEGGQGDVAGGLGGVSSAILSVFGGESLEVHVGGAGATTTSSASGGYNGGGSVSLAAPGGLPAGSGGGASDVRRFPHGEYERLVVAGGGGGWGEIGAVGGDGGGWGGVPGQSWDWGSYPGGEGGAQQSGGPALQVLPLFPNEAGSFGKGGDCWRDLNGCGAGGGGWYGGGAGMYGGGGGGAGHLSASVISGELYVGKEAGDGAVVIRW